MRSSFTSRSKSRLIPSACAAAVGAQLGEYALDLRLLTRAQLPELVVRLHGGHGFYKERGPGAGHVVHQAGHGVFELRLHRHHIAVGARGDYGVLQGLGVAGRGNYLLQRLAHPRARGAYQAAYVRELAARGVGYLLLAGYRARNLVLQEAVRLYRLEEVVYAGLFRAPPVAGGIALRRAGRGEHAGYVHQLARIQHAAHVRPLKAGPDVLQAGKRRAAAFNHHPLAAVVSARRRLTSASSALGARRAPAPWRPRSPPRAPAWRARRAVPIWRSFYRTVSLRLYPQFLQVIKAAKAPVELIEHVGLGDGRKLVQALRGQFKRRRRAWRPPKRYSASRL